MHCSTPVPSNLWNLVLAAGSGRRLAGVTGAVPKQFWSADGGSTLLEDTLKRTAPLAPPERTVIVVDRTHAPFVDALPHVERSHRVVYQPRDRGTAAGVLLGLTEVVAMEPDARVLLTPSDHGVTRPREFLTGLCHAARTVHTNPDHIVLFGVEAESAEGDYGWITPAGEPAADTRLRPVAAFVEKPVARVARQLFESGAVWNTMVLVARASALLELYRSRLPELTAIFMHSLGMSGEERGVFLHAQYENIRAADFSHDLLSRADGLSLHTWPASIGWSDLGTPARLERWRDGQSSDRAAASFRAGMSMPQPCC